MRGDDYRLKLSPPPPITVSGVQAPNRLTYGCGMMTVLCMGMSAVLAHWILKQRLLLLIGLVMAYAIYAIATNILGLGMGRLIFALITDADWFDCQILAAQLLIPMPIIAPVAFILVAENLGHIKAVGAMTGRKFNTVSWQSICGRWRKQHYQPVGRHRYDHYGENIGD